MSTKYNNKQFLKHLEKVVSNLSDKELNSRYYGIWHLKNDFNEYTKEKFGIGLKWDFLTDMTLIYCNEINKRIMKANKPQ